MINVGEVLCRRWCMICIVIMYLICDCILCMIDIYFEYVILDFVYVVEGFFR